MDDKAILWGIMTKNYRWLMFDGDTEYYFSKKKGNCINSYELGGVANFMREVRFGIISASTVEPANDAARKMMEEHNGMPEHPQAEEGGVRSELL